MGEEETYVNGDTVTLSSKMDTLTFRAGHARHSTSTHSAFNTTNIRYTRRSTHLTFGTFTFDTLKVRHIHIQRVHIRDTPGVKPRFSYNYPLS